MGLSLLVDDLVGLLRAPHVLALVVSAGSAAAMVANPLFGWLADITRGPLGRRRPWLLGGAAVGLLGTLAMLWAPGPWWLAAAWVVTQAAYNACFGSLNGWVSEGLPPELRSRAAGVFSAAAFIGVLPGLAAAGLLASQVTAMLLVMPVIALVVIVPVGLRITDPPLAVATARPRSWADGMRSVASRGFVGAWLVRLVFAAALSASLVLGLFMFMERWALERVEAAQLLAAATFAGAVGVVAASLVLTARTRRRWDDRQLLAAALATLALALAAAGLAPTVLVFLATTFVAGLAIGTGFTCTRAVVHAVLPHDQSGFGLGLLNVATTLAPIIAPLLASGLLAWSRAVGMTDPYTGMLILLGAVTLCGLFALRLVPRTSSIPTATASV